MMAVQVYGCNHIVIEVTDAKKAVRFYSDVFGLKMLRGGEGAAWCKLGEHQFMAIFEVKTLQPDRRSRNRGTPVAEDLAPESGRCCAWKPRRRCRTYELPPKRRPQAMECCSLFLENVLRPSPLRNLRVEMSAFSRKRLQHSMAWCILPPLR